MSDTTCVAAKQATTSTTSASSDAASAVTLQQDSEARARALNPEHSFCVTAPAGSGKTELLTQRILALLPRVERPEQILAITFTRKAAAEMRERLVEKLEEAERGEPVSAAHEQKTRDLALAVLAHAKVKGWSLDPELFNLRTIDSLCGELTRQMPILSAIGGAVEVTDQHRPLFLEAVAELMSSVGQDDLTGRALRALLLHFDNDWERLRDLLVALLERRGDWGNRLGLHHTPEESRQSVEAAVASLTASVLSRARRLIGSELAELEALAAHAADNLGLPPPTLGADPSCVSDWRQAIGMLVKGDNKDFYKSWNKNNGFPTDSKAEKARLAELVAALRARGDGLFDTLVEIRSLPEMQPGDAGWELVLHLSHLLPVLLAQLLLIFQREGKVDFAHIALAAEDALGPDEEPTNLALRLDYQLEHILVDEFQDTSDQQMRLLKKLTRGWAEHNAAGGAPRTLFIVGDGMQSIYGFRYANVGLFLEARQHGIGGVLLEPLALTRNFRSQQGVVDWVNSTFQQLLPESDDPARGQVTHVWADATHDPLPGDAVSSHLFPEDGGVTEAAFIAEQITQIRSQYPEASIAVLVRARRHVLPLISALQQQGVPYLGRDLENLRNTPTVMDLISLCRWLANPADDVAALSLLRAPFCGLTLSDIQTLLAEQPRPLSLRSALARSEMLLEPARAEVLLKALDWAIDHRDRLSLPVWVEQTWLRLGGHRVAGESGYRDAERFFDLLRRAETEGVGLDMAWLDLRLDQLFAEHEPVGHPVELMTVHKSKGLQFDYVFMPQLHKGVSGNDRALLRWHLHVDHDGPVGQDGLIIAADDRRQKGEPSLYNYLNWLQAQKDAAELRRLLYVGVTRARNRVWLTAEARQSETDTGELELKAPSRASPMGVLMTAIGEQTCYHLAGQTDGASNVAAISAGFEASSPPNKAVSVGDNPYLQRVKIQVEVKAHEQGVLQGAHQEGEKPVGLSADARANLYRASNLRERALGTALHRALELLSQRDALPPVTDGPTASAIELCLRAHGLSGATLLDTQADVEHMVNTALADERGRWILSAREGACCELVLFDISKGEPRKHIIDRTFIAESSHQRVRWIIDYKSSQPNPEESLESFYQREKAHYVEQLAGYRRLMAGRDPEGVEICCALYFPAVAGWAPLE